MPTIGLDDSKLPRPPAPSVPWSVAAQLNEREMRMRCLELAIHMLDKRYERRDIIDRQRHPLMGPTPQQIADDLMAYTLTGEHRELFRVRT